jgi:hypothetical protein
MYLLLEGYHRLEWARRNGMTRVPVNLISPWKEGQKLSLEELLHLKQLRNFTETNRQNDGMSFLICGTEIQAICIYCCDSLIIGTTTKKKWIYSTRRIWLL